jgi:ATP-dependent helicase/DNAse subunit B
MGLSLVVGPAHAGKVALLLERYVELLDRDPWLIVPNRPDVERVERDLVGRAGGLLGGRISTFDGLFEHLARGSDPGRPLVAGAGRALLVRRASAQAHAAVSSSRFPGYAESLGAAIAEAAAALLDPDDLSGELAAATRAYGAQLDALRLWDRDALRRAAVDRLTGDLAAWDGRPVLAYGFEDLTGAEWRLLEALAARGEVCVSLPYEPGRAAYESLSRTADDLAALADEIVRLPSASAQHLPRSLAHLERHLFADDQPRVPLDGAVRFLEGAGRRATFELVAEEALELVAQGIPPEEIAVVAPSVEPVRRALEAAFAALGVPIAIEAPTRLQHTPLGRALLDLLRFAWAGAGRRALFGFLRSPFSGLARGDVDFVEGRLRGRAVTEPDRVVEVSVSLRGGRPLPLVDDVREAGEPLTACRTAATALVRHAHGTDGPRASDERLDDLRALDAVLSVLDELQRVHELGVPCRRDDVLAALERATVPGARPGEPGRVPVLDLMRVRTRRFDTVFVLGLEQGALPRRPLASPFLDDDVRREIDSRKRSRLTTPDQASRDRYLFLTACTRPTHRLVLVREAATDEGSPRDASPFWEAVQALFDPDDVRRATVRRPLSRLTWPIEEAPTERERLRALLRLSADDAAGATALAQANGWERRLERATRAWDRRVTLVDPGVLATLGARETFRVTDLERMAMCSAAWFVERFLSPGEIDRGPDAKLRGQIAHTALQRFYTQLPSAIPGAERVTQEDLEEALALMRECVDGAVESGVRFDVTDVERRELLHSLRRDLEQLVRQEAGSPSRFVPRKLEVAFAGYDLGDGVAVSGKIDRVDVDPMSARGIVVDYKSGRAPSARQIHDEARVQVPLYMLVMRDQLGLEPVGGLYVPVGGGRRPRGIILDEDESVPGHARDDYLDADAFAAEVEYARATAVELAGRIRTGDVRHDPRDGECPSWCDLWRICRKERP